MLVASVVLFANLGRPRLWDRDEPRNAGCAREMLERGDWVTPMFNAELRTAKPVLTYWLIMTAYTVFGQGEFAARFFSALLALGTVAATYAIAKRLFNAQTAFWSGLILATTLMFNVAGHAATPDSPLIFCVTLALAAFVVLTVKPSGGESDAVESPQLRYPGEVFPQRWTSAVIIYAIMGLAVLAKGPVGVVLPCAIIGMFLLLMRLPKSVEQAEAAPSPTSFLLRGAGLLGILALALCIESWGGMKAVLLCGAILCAGLYLTGHSRWLRFLRPFEPMHFLQTCWSMRLLTAVFVVLVIAAPWYVWVGLRTDGEFLKEFFLKEHFGRATTAMENHNGPFIFYPLAILAGFFPWSVLAAPLLVDLVRRLRSNDPWKMGYVFAACWAGVWVGVFSLAATKLPSYITPCYPAVSLLAGCFVFRLSRGEIIDVAWRRVSLASLGTVGAVMLIGGFFALGALMPGSQWLALLGVIPLAACGLAFVCFESARHRSGVAVLGCAAALFVGSVFAVGLPEVDRHRSTQSLVATAHQRQNDLAAYGVLEPSWVFYSGQPFPFFPPQDATDAVRHFRRAEHAAMIMSTTDYDRIRQRLPKDAVVVDQTNAFLKDETLVLVARDKAAAQQAKARSGKVR